MIAYAQALLVDKVKLEAARASNDVTLAQEILQDAFRTDLRPLVAEARVRGGGAIRPLGYFRERGIRQQLVVQRGSGSVATGL
jgi:L-rhamnose isomerase/sugar isomerase